MEPITAQPSSQLHGGGTYLHPSTPGDGSSTSSTVRPASTTVPGSCNGTSKSSKDSTSNFPINPPKKAPPNPPKTAPPISPSLTPPSFPPVPPPVQSIYRDTENPLDLHLPRPKFAPPPPPSQKEQRLVTPLPPPTAKALKVPPPKPIRYSSMQHLDIVSQQPEPVQIQRNPQNKARLSSFLPSSTVDSRADREQKAKSMTILQDSATEDLPAPANGKDPARVPASDPKVNYDVPVKPARKNSSGIQLAQELESMQDNCLQTTANRGIILHQIHYPGKPPSNPHVPSTTSVVSLKHQKGVESSEFLQGEELSSTLLVQNLLQSQRTNTRSNLSVSELARKPEPTSNSHLKPSFRQEESGEDFGFIPPPPEFANADEEEEEEEEPSPYNKPIYQQSNDYNPPPSMQTNWKTVSNGTDRIPGSPVPKTKPQINLPAPRLPTSPADLKLTERTKPNFTTHPSSSPQPAPTPASVTLQSILQKKMLEMDLKQKCTPAEKNDDTWSTDQPTEPWINTVKPGFQPTRSNTAGSNMQLAGVKKNIVNELKTQVKKKSPEPPALASQDVKRSFISISDSMIGRSRDEIVGSRAIAQRSYLGPVTALSSLALAQTDCSQGACYPETGDLLIGRANRLRASSTCGLAVPEVFCTPLGQWQMKCCPCDSRTDSSRNSHRIENAFSQAGPLRWWQSQKGVEDVIVQLDLDGKFQLSDLILDFKGPRPEAMVIERSTDFGQTWKPFQYMASDCHASFPHISTSAPQSLQDPHCQTLPPTDSRLYLDQRWQMKCCPCDSRTDSSRNSHRIENAFSQAGPLRWWQSQKGVEDVIVQLDLDGKFQLSDLILDFKGPRPEAMVIERSTDFGQTWKPFQYMASDCHASFPHISTSAPQSLQDPHCQTLPPTDSRLYLDQRVQFNLLEPLSSVDVSDCYKINNGADFTNLRVQFTKLPRLPRRGSSRVPDAFYALKEIQVQGSCFCNGHANRCVPNANELDRPEVFSTCACQHNTAGQNCERCAELYNDQPWRPAEEGNSYQCKKCDCNNHSDRCHFDPAVFEGSGGVSGGVCDDCKHQTAGQHCERCRPRYYRNPLRDISQPDACLRCDCSSEGSEGLCEQSGGRCICKAHVEGPRCDRCRAGFYGLSAADPQGCKECPCSLTGSRGDRACDPQSGRCFCLPNVIGQQCEMCAPDHWNFRSGRGCESCNCDPRNSYNQNCDQISTVPIQSTVSRQGHYRSIQISTVLRPRAGDRAAAVEEKVDGVVDDLGSAQTLLREAGVKVKDTGRNVEDIKSKIPQIQGKLALAESSVEGVGAQLGVIKPQIAVLKELLDQNARLAGQTDRVASQAHTEATSAGQISTVLCPRAGDRAAAVEEKVDGVVDDLGSAQTLLREAGVKVKDTGRIVEDIKSKIPQIQGKLALAESSVEGVGAQLGVIKPQIAVLKELLDQNARLAGQTDRVASQAHTEATTAGQDLATLEQQYALLKEKLGDSAGGAGVPEERLGKLQEQAGRLVQDTADMLRRIAGKESSLLRAAEELEQKVLKLDGLEEKVAEIRANIQKVVHFHSNCL
ncbi:UNVERIFIED_CONTAM: hypothetical protein FKN15_000308 [Acipenser sinensis]